MKIKIYVDWENREVYTEETKAEEIKRRVEDRKTDDYALEEFLDDYCYRNLNRNEKAELFNMSEEKRAEVRTAFAKECEETAKDDFADETEEFEFEI